jgi:hypothetical protein
MQVEQTRPLAVTLLAVLAAIAGIAAFIDTLRFLGLLPIAQLGPLLFFDFSLFGAVLSGIVALIWFSTAGQIWNLDQRGWMFVIFVAVLNLILLLLAWLGRSTFGAVLPGMLIALATLGLAMAPDTRRAFGRT